MSFLLQESRACCLKWPGFWLKPQHLNCHPGGTSFLPTLYQTSVLSPTGLLDTVTRTSPPVRHKCPCTPWRSWAACRLQTYPLKYKAQEPRPLRIICPLTWEFTILSWSLSNICLLGLISWLSDKIFHLWSAHCQYLAIILPVLVQYVWQILSLHILRYPHHNLLGN